MPGSFHFRAVTALVAVLFISVNLATPFLHTHETERASSKCASFSSQHCNACEYEATQAIDPGIAVVLPVTHYTYEVRAFETQSVFLSAVHSSSESRGPPSIS